MNTEIIKLLDPYKILAACMFRVKYGEVGIAYRQAAKTAFFPQVYSQSALAIPENIAEIYSPWQLQELQTHFKVELPELLSSAIAAYFRPPLAQ